MKNNQLETDTQAGEAMHIDESLVSERYENTAKHERVRVFFQCDENDNPRTMCSNETTILCAHTKYLLGDEQFADQAQIDARRAEIIAEGGYLQPLYLYDHSGLTVSTTPFSCPWDSGQIGWIGMEAAQLAERNISATATDAIDAIIAQEMKTWSAYVEGQVYAFMRSGIKQCNHGEVHEEEIEGTGGFYGSNHFDSGLLEEAGIGAGRERSALKDGWSEVGDWTEPDKNE